MSSQPVMQFSFNSGEWSPALNARVDIGKYHSGAALLRNFFVDYRGGATTKPGSRYIYTSQNDGSGPPRLIPFQASFTVTYLLEFGVKNGVGYLGFTNNGVQVLSGGNPYTIASPYASSELSQIKFAQNVNTMVLCHPNHPPYLLTLISATNWTLVPITFGSTIAIPTGLGTSTSLAGGTVFYAYIITAVDTNGQESGPSAFATGGGWTDIRTVAGTITVTWGAVTGASSYNIYRANPHYTNAVPAGSDFGFVGNVTSTTFYDSNIVPDFSQSPPVVRNPFFGSGVQSVTITNAGSYSNGQLIPTVSFTGGGGSGAAASATATCTSAIVSNGGIGYSHGQVIYISGAVLAYVNNIGAFGNIIDVIITSPSLLTSGQATPVNPAGSATSPPGQQATFNLTWQIATVGITSPGTGYGPAPTVVFSSGAAAATAVLGAPSAGNPTVPGFFQQRLVLAGPVGSPQQFNMSQPGSYYNFNVTNPIQGDNAIQGNLVSGQLNTIQSMISQPNGLIMMSDKQAWLINGGSAGSPISATQIVANSQAYNGAAAPPPIVATNDILYVQAKGSIVRDLVYNFYTAIYTGTDISILSSHLFYSFNILQWAWAEEPFKVVWAVRNDGILLSLTFLKEQELIAWAHSDTQGSYKSIATVTETTAAGTVDAVYVVVQRTINGNTVQYIERFAELYYPIGLTDAWCVDAGIQYNGAASLTFTGAQHLAAATVTGLATDNTGVVSVLNFVMPVNGTFTLSAPPAPATGYTRVTVGLGYTPQLQTLQLDTGEPTIQGKRKKITGVTVRCRQTLGLDIGQTFDATSLVPMDDLVIGNLNVALNTLVTDLVTGDARTIIDPDWNIPGQYCIQQSNPYPASILGVIPEITIGDTK